MSRGTPRHSARVRRSLKHKRKLSRRNILFPVVVESLLSAVPSKKTPLVMAIESVDKLTPLARAFEELKVPVS